jgi:hypothetical protein
MNAPCRIAIGRLFAAKRVSQILLDSGYVADSAGEIRLEASRRATINARLKSANHMRIVNICSELP